MDPRHFDALVASLFGTLTRRQMASRAGAGVIGGSAVLARADVAEVKKKKKKRSNVCRGLGEPFTCTPGELCCDACASTVAACRDPGFPVCCISSGFSHLAGSRCCTSFDDGIEGACPPEAQSCCSSDVGAGCCPAEFPVCCEFDCCDFEDFCADDGFCFFGSAASRAGADGAGRSGQGRKRTRGGNGDQRRRFAEPRQTPG